MKTWIGWGIVGLTLVFVGQAIAHHWQEVAAVTLTGSQWAWVGLSLGLTTIAHGWAGWVWGWILRDLGQSLPFPWAMGVYLRTNIAKYLPGNVWHFWGRVQASQQAGIPLGTAVVSVVLEALLMALGALGLGLWGWAVEVVLGGRIPGNWGFLGAIALPLGLLWAGGVLVLLRPRWLNLLLAFLSRKKLSRPPAIPVSSEPYPASSPEALEPYPVSSEPYPISSPKAFEPYPASSLTDSPSAIPSRPGLVRYPWRSLAGELGFLGLRGLGFGAIVVAVQPLSWSQMPGLVGGFCGAWLLGLVVPGAPGGVGVFESVAIVLLGGQISPGPLVVAIALYRLVSTLAEGLGAGVGWLLSPPHGPTRIEAETPDH